MEGKQVMTTDLQPLTGRYLDFAIAEQVMGWVAAERFPKDPAGIQRPDGLIVHRSDVPAYSTDIVAAWQVAETMRVKGWTCEVYCMDETSRWFARFRRPDDGWFCVGADGAPEAICRAALAAVAGAVQP